MIRRSLQMLVLFCALGVFAQVSAGQKLNELVVFGDSLSDPGNAFALLGEQSLPPYLLIPEAPYAIGGHHFSNGRTWIETLAHKFGVVAGPAFSPQGRFNNYAIGAARARAFGQIYLSMQVATYLGRNSGKAAAENLYILFIGGNDVRDAVASFAIDPEGVLAAEIITDAIAAVDDNMNALANAGAKQFLVLNVPDISLVPAVRMQGTQTQQAASALASQYNNELAQVVARLKVAYPVEIKTVDIFALLHSVVANPEEFDLINVQDTCITPEVIANAICAKPDSYLFWDGIHPTRKMHKVIADAAHATFESKHTNISQPSRYAHRLEQTHSSPE